MLKINFYEKSYLSVIRSLFTIIFLLNFSINLVVNAMVEPYNTETDIFAYKVFNLDLDKDFDRKPLLGQVAYVYELNPNSKYMLAKGYRRLFVYIPS